jgi:hypothetical protein
MRRLAVLVGVAGMLGAMAVTGAGTAVAGGPTSVLVVAPETGRTAAVHTMSPAYDVLAKSVEAGERGKQQTSARADVRLTWLIHDVQVWRIDEVYLGLPGGPWIATRQSWDGNALELEPTWHRSAQPARLLQLLAGMKVLDAKAASSETQALVDDAQAAAPADDSRTAAASSSGDRFSVTGWRWVLPGLLAGAALTYLALRLNPGWLRRERGPRVELIDE